MKRFVLVPAGMFLACHLATATNYYWNGSGAINATTSWGTNADGSGVNPTNFTTAGNSFVLQNGQTATLGAAWTVSGSGSKIIVQNGAVLDSSTFTISNGSSGSIDLNSGATMRAAASYSGLNFGAVDASSTFVYYGSNTLATASKIFGNLTLQPSAAFTPGSPTTTGNLAISNNTAQVVANSGTTSNTWTIGGNVTINSAVAFSSGTSTSTGSATINVGGGLTNAGTISRGSGASSALINFNGTGASNVTWGTTTGAFNVSIGAGKTITFVDNLTVSNSTLTVNGTLTTSATRTATVGTTVLAGGTINGAGSVSSSANYDFQSGSVSAVLGGTASLVKSTSATVTLSGANTFSGGTTVSNGTLALGSSGAISGGALTVTAGGAITSSVSNVNVGGPINFTDATITLNGASVGSLSLTSASNFVMSGGALNLTLGASIDQIIGNGGTFSLTNTTLNFDTSGGGVNYGSSYQLFHGYGSGVVSGLSFTGLTGYTASLSGTGALSFSPTAIPEPSTYAAIFGSLALTGVLLQRRLRKGRLSQSA